MHQIWLQLRIAIGKAGIREGEVYVSVLSVVGVMYHSPVLEQARRKIV